ncbi:MBL fold metallo-hydrolase [candidate division WWE3 bacterium]|nr:MBL fold metallo-hydrolase [candidate division WWE3 bacterium]
MKRFIKLLFIFSILSCVVIFFLLKSSIGPYFKMSFLNVGQGDATLIQVGLYTQILIDTGPNNITLSRLAEEMPFNDHSIEYIFISHPHADHIQGLLDILDVYNVGTVFMNPIVYESPIYAKLVEKLAYMNIIVRQFRAGSDLMIGDVSVHCLWPNVDELTPTDNPHDYMMILVVRYKKISALFPGDYELSGNLPELIRSHLDPVVIVKVPHQGSDGAIDSDILMRLSPDIAIIPVGPNKYGHPTRETLDLLHRSVRLVFRTDKDGTIRIVSQSDGSYGIMR